MMLPNYTLERIAHDSCRSVVRDAGILFQGTKALLLPQHVLFLYEPYRRFGHHTSGGKLPLEPDS